MRPQSLAGHRRVRTCSRLRHCCRSATATGFDDASLASLTLTHLLSLSLSRTSSCTHISSKFTLTHIHTYTLARSLALSRTHSTLFVHSSLSFRSARSAVAEAESRNEVLSHCCRCRCCCPFTRLDWPRRVCVLVLLLASRIYMCVCVSSRRFVLCWFGQRRQRQRKQSDSRRSRSRSRAQRRRARRSPTVAPRLAVVAYFRRYR